MDNNNQTPFIDSKLLILLTFANSLLFGYIKIYYESNSALRLKIEIIWLLIKALIILLNSKYMYKLVYNLTHDQDISVSFWSIIRNTHLLSCICTLMAFLILIWVAIRILSEDRIKKRGKNYDKYSNWIRFRCRNTMLWRFSRSPSFGNRKGFLERSNWDSSQTLWWRRICENTSAANGRYQKWRLSKSAWVANVRKARRLRKKQLTNKIFYATINLVKTL